MRAQMTRAPERMLYIQVTPQKNQDGKVALSRGWLGIGQRFQPCLSQVNFAVLEKNPLKPWLKQCWCIPPEANAEFVCCMEDVLEVYQRPFDPKRPLVCMDEISKQLLADSRPPLPMQPGQPERYDYEYVRHGTANTFMFFAPLLSWRPWSHCP